MRSVVLQVMYEREALCYNALIIATPPLSLLANHLKILINILSRCLFYWGCVD
jgi:hypothetical protein